VTKTMRAVVAKRFGGPEVMEVELIPIPAPDKGEVLVAIHAAGTNPVDASNRSDGTWAGISPPIIPGSDASGAIEAIGEGVVDLAPVDEVFYMSDFMKNPMGTYAEYQVVAADIVTKKPERLSHIEAAAVPLAAGTAYEVVMRRLDIQKGEWILIHGAAGGVGIYALQMARARGAQVIASASLPRHSKLMELGASVCLDYRTQDVASAARDAAGGDLDAVADFVGGDLISKSLAVIRPHGRASSIATVEGSLDLLMDRNITLHGVLVRPERARLVELREMLDAGVLHVLIDEVLPLEDAARAHTRLETGHGQGKVVLRVR
jgi:NADPH:quinone reductase